MSDEDSEAQTGDDVDEDTLRIMVSTDNHLGYCDRDPIRGLDSFAAFEEVLILAKRHKCDMVLLAGDLFHHNKPSRWTMHKTIEIMRRYCMGPDPVRFQIVSDQAANFRNVFGTVNYEDEYQSVDLPIMSIHGNHDDPTRDGGTEMLAALDLLSVSNLVNYFGRQDEVDKVEISPVLIRKGTTNVALYGMGSMRDERLNRMWQGKKVRFLKPGKNNEGEDGKEGRPWFNIFALHQNRDLGRGTKNCVHESMIPEWMDLVVWGHEHECIIEPTESVVGTYRITQPGSSVATSLSTGEAVMKQVGILDVRGDQFRLRAIPLSQVRAFSVGEVSLQDHAKDGLNPEDPKIDEKVDQLLGNLVQMLVQDAREKSKTQREEAQKARKELLDEFDIDQHKPKYQLQKPQQVLVRLRVEHTGFTSLNNQRFGSKFVGDVANPEDVLLFHRRKKTGTKGERGASGSPSRRKKGLEEPMLPEELAATNVEDLVKEMLESEGRALGVLDEKRLGVALDEFVLKEQKNALQDTTEVILTKQQKLLIKRGAAKYEGSGANKINTPGAVKEMCAKDLSRARAAAEVKEEEEKEKAQAQAAKRNEIVVESSEDEGIDKKTKASSMEVESDEEDIANAARTKRTFSKASAKKTAAKPTMGSRRAAAPKRKMESDSDEEVPEVEPPPARAPRSRGRPTRRAATSSNKAKYNFDDSDDDDGKNDDDSDAVVVVEEEDDEMEVDAVEEEREARRGRRKVKASPSKRGTRKTSAGTKRKAPATTKTSTAARNTRRRAPRYEDDESDDDGRGSIANSLGLAAGWGTAKTEETPNKRRRR